MADVETNEIFGDGTPPGERGGREDVRRNNQQVLDASALCQFELSFIYLLFLINNIFEFQCTNYTA